MSTLSLCIVGILSSCGDSDESGINLTVPSPDICADPAQCISITAICCAPRSSTYTSNGVDLSLILPSFAKVEVEVNGVRT